MAKSSEAAWQTIGRMAARLPANPEAAAALVAGAIRDSRRRFGEGG